MGKRSTDGTEGTWVDIAVLCKGHVMTEMLFNPITSSTKAAFGEVSTGKGGEARRDSGLTAPSDQGCSGGSRLQLRPPGRRGS
jgi:hypothetical protein